MERLPIFEGLNLTVQEAEDLALYWKAAGEATGTIDKNGYLKTGERTWKRPLAQDNFKALKKALKAEENCVSWITACEDKIKLDFSKLQYNLEWIKGIIKKYQLGVSNCRYGLLLFAPQVANGETWYSQQNWEMKGVTVEDLGLTRYAICPTSPNQSNPRTAEWRSLYFAE